MNEEHIIILPEPAKFFQADGTVKETNKLVLSTNKNAGIKCVSCRICGRVLYTYEVKRAVECALCGIKDESHLCCPDGHYVCSACWKSTSECFICHREAND